jgi:hypothetical protein
MQQWLKEEFGVEATVMYDRPQDFFKGKSGEGGSSGISSEGGDSWFDF